MVLSLTLALKPAASSASASFPIASNCSIPFQKSGDAFATTILGGSQQLAFDGEGRVMLPESLITTAALSDMAIFVGKGETFEIWEPKAFDAYAVRARDLAREKRLRLRGEGAAQ